MPPQDQLPAGLEEFAALCRRNGLPLTVQRRALLEVLTGRQDHPTADQIFDDVRARIPGISRATVYRTLDTLVNIGVARKVCHPGATARFETKTRRHHHLVCLQCGKMIDLEDPLLDRIPLPDTRSQGFHVADYSIQFRGTCSGCLRKSRARPDKQVQKRRNR